ncbi:MAG: YraN family protein [Ruminiclostridium sp.]|nr:YraN family protein [Ruminiclostridium sp.]MBQ9932721.1 YraN family protein [Ruminiclostridium sp.]
MRGGDWTALGLWGEEQAARWLKWRGYRILETRYRCREGEIDLVAQRGNFLCFVEVKLRKDNAMAEAREFVTPAKQRKVRTAAMYYLMEHPTQKQPRFDVVEVYAPQGQETRRPVIRHWPDAF